VRRRSGYTSEVQQVLLYKRSRVFLDCRMCHSVENDPVKLEKRRGMDRGGLIV
jgi:hypothetical protein